ncbi:MAG: hypothetical protein AB8B69_09300, partial [Chitinophagales bacterium]
MKKQTKKYLINGIKILLLSTLFFFGNCNFDNTTMSTIKSKNSFRIPNLERDTPVVWQIQDELYCYMYWIGNFETKIDTVFIVDPVTYNQTHAIFNQTIREGVWYLKDCEDNI